MSTPPPAALVLSDDTVELLDSGVHLLVATRDATLFPESVVGMGIRVQRNRRTITVYVPTAGAARTLDNIRDNGLIAVTAGHPPDHRSLQLKGRVSAVREGTEADRKAQDLFRGALAESLAVVGIPRAASRRFTFWPSTAIDFVVTDVFVQTPGPGAGERIKG